MDVALRRAEHKIWLHSFRSRAPRFNTVPSHPGVSVLAERTRNLVALKV
jgi:hypothetical protein